MGLFFRFLTYPHNPSPDSYCQGLGKGKKKRKRCRGKWEKAKTEPLRTLNQGEGNTVLRMFAGWYLGQKVRAGKQAGNKHTGRRVEIPKWQNRWQFQARLCLVLDDTGIEIQKEFWPSELGWKLHTLLFLPSPIHMSSAIKWKKTGFEFLNIWAYVARFYLRYTHCSPTDISAHGNLRS